MKVSGKISLSSSSSISSCSSVGTRENSCKTVLCHPLTNLPMNESTSKSSVTYPSSTNIEAGDSHTVLDNESGGNATEVDVRTSPRTHKIAITGPIPSEDNSIDKVSNTANCTKSMDNAHLISSKNEAISDAIADIAASANIRSRRKKRERSESAAALKLNPPLQTDHIPTLTHPPTIVTASMSNHYVPPRLQIGMSSNKKFKSTEKTLAGGLNNADSKISVHMLNSVGLECGEDGKVILERFDGDLHAGIRTNDSKSARPIKMEDNLQIPLPWTLDLHREFAAAIFEIGLKNCSPSIIMENMRKQPRYTTRERTKSHLQKYRQTKQRSKGEFLKEFDAFFESTEKAKALLNTNNSNDNLERKEPFTKAILTKALEGKKPNKLLGGKAAALLSYSVLNGFSTSHGPDQLQYKAAKLSEFPALTEEEKRTSVGASLLQVKTLIDNMTDILLKTRHGINPFPVGKPGIGDDESVSASSCSSDEGYSDQEEENEPEGGCKSDKNATRKAESKNQDSMVVPPPVPKSGGLFPMNAVAGASANPLYRPPPAAYPAPFPAPGAPPPSVATGYPPPQYPHAQPPFYGSAPPHPHIQQTAPPAFGAPASFHPQVHYPQDPRMNPYQQAPAAQVGPYPAVPTMPPSYYPPVAGYPSYYGGTNESSAPPATSTGNTTANYPPGDVYAKQRQSTDVYDQQPSPYANNCHGDRSYAVDDNSTDKRRRRKAEKREKHHRRRNDRDEVSLSMDTTERNDFGDFLDRLSNVPSPRKSSSSPIQRAPKRSRKLDEEKYHSPRHYQTAFDTPVESNSYSKNRRSPEDQLSEAGIRSFKGSRDPSPVHRSPSDRRQRQSHDDQRRHADKNGQTWESSTFEATSYNEQQQSQSTDFHQQPAQLDLFSSGPEQQQQYLKSAQNSPMDGSARNYFFGE